VSVLTLEPELRQRLEEISNRRYRVRAGRILERTIPGLEQRKKHYPKGSMIWTKGEPANAIYLIKSGNIHSILPVSDKHKASKDSWFARVFFGKRGTNTTTTTNNQKNDDDDEQVLSDLECPDNGSEEAIKCKDAKKTRTNIKSQQEQEIVVAEWYPGDVIGISALVGSTRMASAIVVSNEGADIIEIGKDELRKRLETEASLRENLARHFRRFKERALSVDN
jgi:CRP-like cAMP-binding protein